MPRRRCGGLRLPRSGRRGAVLPGAPPETEARQPPGGPREHPRATVEALAPQHEAALPLAGLRVRLAARSARRLPRQAAYRAHQAPRRLPPAASRAQGVPARAGAGRRAAAAGAPTGPRHLGRWARARARAHPLVPWGPGRCRPRAQSAARQAQPLHLGAVSPGPRPRHESTALSHGGQPSPRVCLQALLCPADARTPEEPEAGTLHVRDWTGGAG